MIYVSRGRLRSVKYDKMCVDHLQRDEAHKAKTYSLGQYQCHAFVGNSQYYTLSKNGMFRNEYMCAVILSTSQQDVKMVACDGHEEDDQYKWDWVKNDKKERQGMLKHKTTNRCIQADADHSSANLLLVDCDSANEELFWTFDFDQNHPEL